jgi:general secretion pathway protein H
MPISGRGSSAGRRRAGFTLIEVMVVLAIVAIGAGLVALTIRDPAETRLESEAARLVALLESARTEARAAGLAAVWVPDAEGGSFRFVGLPAAMALPTRWLDDGVRAEVVGRTSVTLGPEAILPRQRIVLHLDGRRLEVDSDGLTSFAVAPPTAAATP